MLMLVQIKLTHSGSSLVVETVVFLQLLVKFPSRGKLQDQIDSCVIVEVAKEPQYVRMSTTALDNHTTPLV